MLAVLFAVSYQSIHAFSHNHHLKDDSHHLTFKTSEKTFNESDDCLICDFKFTVFLSPEVVHFEFIPSFYEIPYQFNTTKTFIEFDGNSFYLRGPPVLMV